MGSFALPQFESLFANVLTMLENFGQSEGLEGMSAKQLCLDVKKNLEKGDTHIGDVKDINEQGNGNKEAEGGDGGADEKVDIIEEVDAKK